MLKEVTFFQIHSNHGWSVIDTLKESRHDREMCPQICDLVMAIAYLYPSLEGVNWSAVNRTVTTALRDANMCVLN